MCTLEHSLSHILEILRMDIVFSAGVEYTSFEYEYLVLESTTSAQSPNTST